MEAHPYWNEFDARDESNIKRAVKDDDLLSALLAIAGIGPEDGLMVAQHIALLAAEVHMLVAQGSSELEALTAILAIREELKGDTETYFSFENSLIDRVFARSKGQPILLTCIWVLVGQSANIDIEGAALPGHFIAILNGDPIDPFQGGKPLSGPELKQLARIATRSDTFNPEWLKPVDTAVTALRILRNLCRSLRQANEEVGYYRALRLLCACEPNDFVARTALAQWTEQHALWTESIRHYRELAKMLPEEILGQRAKSRAEELSQHLKVLN